MDNRLYVTNLSYSANEESLRAYFGVCGAVSQVQLMAERQGIRTVPVAYVIMATEAAAQQAVRRLNGTSLDGRALTVSAVAGNQPATQPREESRRSKAADTSPKIAVVQQYRERTNMTYELDCAGEPLILRVFFPADSGPPAWRVEARNKDGADVATIEKTASTRALALSEVAEAWQARATAAAVPTLDWQAVTRCMQAVRAI